MLARFQRFAVLVVVVAVMLWLWFLAASASREGWQWLVLPLIVLPHALVLALEFALLGFFGRSAPAPHPTPLQLAVAWWGEVWNGVAVFGWRQPWASNSIPDAVSAAPLAGRRGVVLVHGFVCNRGLWNPWLRRLRKRRSAFVAVNLEPVLGSIDDYVPLIDAAIAQVYRATGLAPVVVAHSMGGLATRAWMQWAADDARVHRVITIGTPHHGTWLGRFALSANGRQMSLNSAWIARLAAQEPASRHAAFTCFFGHCDNIVFPAATAMLEGADNRHLTGVAHVAMVHAPDVYRELERWLDE